MCSKLINFIWISLALIFVPAMSGCGSRGSIEDNDRGSIENDDDAMPMVFKQIKKGMKEEQVKEILKDFKCVPIGSGLAIDSYTLNDQSVVNIWFIKGRVMMMRHNDEIMIK